MRGTFLQINIIFAPLEFIIKKIKFLKPRLKFGINLVINLKNGYNIGLHGNFMNKDSLLRIIDMRLSAKSRIVSFIIILFLLGSYCIPISVSEKIDTDFTQCNLLDDGQILFAPMWGTTTYLIDHDGTVNHTWSSSYFPGVSVWWLGDGIILRSIRVGVGPGSGGAGGGVQKVQWDGTLLWDFRYNTDGYLSHHDLKSLPNGNVLLIAWETKTRNEAIAAGRNPSYISNNGFMPDHIIEVQPTGPTSGDIVWEWHVWDHLIQDYDPSKDNYGVVEDHPELVDVNYASSHRSDWMHTNSIDYNEEFDQIMISVPNFNEIWIIDHSTTTEEAAGHNGGNSGKGGDILYRWGNPHAYRAGITSDQKFFSQHDASWIKEGCPGEGNILVFNNGQNRPGSDYSSVDEIIPPVNEYGEYYIEPGSAFGPDDPIWIYTSDPPSSFFAHHLCGAQRLPDGNTLICDGEGGEIFEVTPEGDDVWQYTNPYPNPLTNDLFKVIYIPFEDTPDPEVSDLDCIGSLSWENVQTGEMVNGSFQVQNIGGSASLLNWTINISSIDWGTWYFSEEFGYNLTPEDGEVIIQVSVIAPDEQNSEFEGYLRVENLDNPEDFDIVPVYLKTPQNTHLNKQISNKFLQEFKQFLCL